MSMETISNHDWCWMMDYCKKRGIPPAQEWAWKEAKAVLENFKNIGCACGNPKASWRRNSLSEYLCEKCWKETTI